MDDHLRHTTNEQEKIMLNHLPESELFEEENEWEAFVYEDSQTSETVSGIIVAHLPDLGENGTPLPTKENRFSSLHHTLRHYGKTWYIGFSSSVGGCARLIHNTLRKKKEGDKKNEQEVISSKKKIYTKLIVVGVIFLIFGVALLNGGSKNSKKVTSTESPEKVDQSLIVQKENNAADQEKKEHETNVLVEQVAKEKAIAEQKAKEKAAAELAAKQQAAAEQAAKEKAVAEQKAKEKAAAELAAKQQAEKEKNPNSPWERPVSSDYSPWTMNSTQRIDAAATNAIKQEADQAGIAVAASSNNVPLIPMSPIPQMSTETTAIPSQQSNVTVTTSVNGNVYPQAPIQQQNYQASTVSVPKVQNPGGFASSSQFARGPQSANVSPPYAANTAGVPMPIARSAVPAPSSGRIPIAESSKSYQAHYNQYQTIPGSVPYVASSPVHPQVAARPANQPYIPSPGPYPQYAGQVQQPNVYQNNTYQPTNYHIPATAANYSASQPMIPSQPVVTQQNIPGAQYQYAPAQQPLVQSPNPQQQSPALGGAYPQGVIPTTQSRLY